MHGHLCIYVCMDIFICNDTYVICITPMSFSVIATLDITSIM